jgi:hypothetical protein
MNHFKILALIVFLTASTSMTLLAEWFDGDVQKTDIEHNTITITEIDPITEAEETKEILVDSTTVFSGVASLKEIREDDDVTIEAQYDEPTDAWKALSVEVAEAGA